MKALSIFFSALLSLAVGVFALPSEPSDREVLDMKAPGISWPPDEPPPVNDITFSWCRDYNLSTTYDLQLLDSTIIDQLEDVGASGGQCMLFNWAARLTLYVFLFQLPGLSGRAYSHVHRRTPLDAISMSKEQTQVAPQRTLSPLLCWLADNAMV
ncbi:hypothetical protein ACHAQJ_009578 [Trichoderma viride]